MAVAIAVPSPWIVTSRANCTSVVVDWSTYPLGPLTLSLRMTSPPAVLSVSASMITLLSSDWMVIWVCDLSSPLPVVPVMIQPVAPVKLSSPVVSSRTPVSNTWISSCLFGMWDEVNTYLDPGIMVLCAPLNVRVPSAEVPQLIVGSAFDSVSGEALVNSWVPVPSTVPSAFRNARLSSPSSSPLSSASPPSASPAA